MIYNSEDITLQRNITDKSYSRGIGVWSSANINLYANTVTEACNGGGEECISIADSRYVEVIGNEVYKNGTTNDFGYGSGGEGIDIKDGSHMVLQWKEEMEE